MHGRVFAVGIFLFFCGAAAYSFFFHELPEDATLEARVGERAVIEGLVVTEPAVKENGQRFVVAGGETKLRVSAEMYPRVQYGDTVRLEGVLKKPEAFATESGRMFEYPRYLAKDGIGYTLSFPEVTVLERGGGLFIKRTLFSVRRAFLKTLERAVPQPGAALLGGITVGAEDGMNRTLEDTFRVVGLVHIIVLSGYNITIVAEIIGKMLSRFSLGVSWAGSAAGIVLFVVMTGASPATVRAGIMALLVIIARAAGRRYDMGRALTIAAAAMVLHNPHILLYDPSFQLSFLATLGLLYGAPFFENKCAWVPQKFGLRETVAATLGTQFFVLPLLVYQTGSVSVVSLLANVLVLWTIPFAMALAAVTGVLGMLSLPLALPTGFLAYAISAYVIWTAEILARLPFASVSVGVLPLSGLVVLYGALALATFSRVRRMRRLRSAS